MADGYVIHFEDTPCLVNHLNEVGYRPVKKQELLDLISINWVHMKE